MSDLLDVLDLGPWMRPLCVLTAAALAGWCAHVVLFWFVQRLARRRGEGLEQNVVWPLKRPTWVLLPVLAMHAALPVAGLPFDIEAALEHGLAVVLILAGAWLSMAGLEAVQRFLARRALTVESDDWNARRLRTQLTVLTRTARTAILLVAAGAVLVTFPGVRQVGTSILASAGIAGIIVGIAAQPTLANLIAGLQIAVSQPLRIGDVIVFQGETGRVEEIAATFIVVRLGDDRRVIVPLRWFLENPFENWTRTSSQLLGYVVLRVDFDAPMEALRAELKRLCEESPDWDQRECQLQVTDCSESTLEIKAVVSAAESVSLGRLRMHVRESMIAYLREEHPSTLPRFRAELGDYAHLRPEEQRAPRLRPLQ